MYSTLCFIRVKCTYTFCFHRQNVPKCIIVFGKFIQLIPIRILQTFSLHHSTEGASIFVRSALFLQKKNQKNYLSSFIKNVQYRVSTSHQLFHSKTPQCNWDQEGVYKDDAPFYCTITKCLAQFKNPQRAFEHSRRMDPTSTIITHLNIQAIQRIGMCDRKSLSIV